MNDTTIIIGIIGCLWSIISTVIILAVCILSARRGRNGSKITRN